MICKTSLMWPWVQMNTKDIVELLVLTAFKGWYLFQVKRPLIKYLLEYKRAQKNPKESKRVHNRPKGPIVSKWVQMSLNESKVKGVNWNNSSWRFAWGNVSKLCVSLTFFRQLQVDGKVGRETGGLDCRAFYCHNSRRGRHPPTPVQEGGGSLSSRLPCLAFCSIAGSSKTSQMK